MNTQNKRQKEPAAQRINAAFWTTAIFAFLTIVVPILWDRYKTTAAISVEEVSITPIVNTDEAPAGLALTYAGEAVDTLTNVTFRLRNSGRAAFRAAQVVEPIQLRFLGAKKIFDLRVVDQAPRDLKIELTSSVPPEAPSVIVRFPLLNPGDTVTFSVLVDQVNPRVITSARIEGVHEIEFVQDATGASAAQLRISWNLVAAALGVLFSFGFVAIAIASLSMQKIVIAQWKNGLFGFPMNATAIDYWRFTEAYFKDIRVKFQLRPMEVALQTLGDGANATDEQQREIEAAFERILETRYVDHAVLIIFGALAGVGLAYIVFSVS